MIDRVNCEVAKAEDSPFFVILNDKDTSKDQQYGQRRLRDTSERFRAARTMSELPSASSMRAPLATFLHLQSQYSMA